MVDTFSPQINKSENFKVIINEVANLTINDFRNDSNGVNASVV